MTNSWTQQRPVRAPQKHRSRPRPHSAPQQVLELPLSAPRAREGEEKLPVVEESEPSRGVAVIDFYI